MTKSTKITLLAMVAALIIAYVLLIVLTEPPPNTITQHPVETIEFVRGESANESKVFVKTDRENFILGNYSIDFIRAESGSELTLDEVDYGAPRSSFSVNPYNLHVPEDQIEALNTDYKKTFGEELVFVDDESTK